MNQRIIIVGEQGVGKSQLAALIAAGSGLPIVEEWDGISELPAQCIAVITIDPIDFDLHEYPSGCFFVGVIGNEMEKVMLPTPIGEVTVTGNISDFKKSILAGA
jgi:hypothetical protein